jgi:hypothetical protein
MVPAHIPTMISVKGRGDPTLFLIFAIAISVGNFTCFDGTKKQHLRQPFVCVNPCRKRRGIGNFQSNVALPFRLKRRHVDNNTAAGISAFAKANGKNVAWDTEILNTTRQRERVWRHDANVRLYIHERFRVEILGINDRIENIRENLEFISYA